MKITIEGEAKEIAALVLELQERQDNIEMRSSNAVSGRAICEGVTIGGKVFDDGPIRKELA